MIQTYEEYQNNGVSLYIIIDIIKVIYLNLNTLSLFILSTNQSKFYYLLLPLIIIEKSALIFFNFRLRKEEQKSSTLVYMLQVSLNINDFNRFEKREIFNDSVIYMISYGSVIVYHSLMISYLFFSGQLYTISKPIILNILLIQLFIGFVYISLVLLFILVVIDKARFSLISFFQFISILVGVVSLQGLNLLLLKNYTAFLFILIWKLVSSLVQSEIIISQGLDFFGCVPNIKYQNRIICLMFNLLNLPVDYAPFFDLIEIQYNVIISFKCQQMVTQTSLAIVRAGQLLDTLIMFCIVQFFDLIGETDSYARLFYQFVKVCLVVNAILSLYHLINKYLQIKTNNYTFYFAQEISLDKLKTILENSTCLRYFEVKKVNGIERLRDDNFDIDVPTKIKERNSLFELYMKQTQIKISKIGINEQFQKDKDSIYINARYFSNQILDMIENHEILQRTILSHFNFEILRNQISKAIIQRLYKYGHNPNFELFYRNVVLDINTLCQEKVKQYFSDIQCVIIFHRLISPCLNTNPKQVIYDLFDEYS